MGYIEFNGSQPNTLTGTLHLKGLPAFGGAYDTAVIGFNKQSAVVVSQRLQVSDGDVVSLNLNQPGQFDPNATVAVLSGGQLLLSGTSPTIGSLVLNNFSGDALPSILDTGGTTVGLNGDLTSGSVTSWNDNGVVTPTIKGNLSLLGVVPFHIGGSAYAGLDMQAAIASPGIAWISKIGNAALLLEGNSTVFEGGTVVREGIVDVRNSGALGPGTYLSGGSLILRNLSISSSGLVAAGQSIAGDMPGSLITCIGPCSWSGKVLLNSNLVVVGDLTLNGQISGSGGIGFFGGGNSLIAGSVANTYTGKTLVRCPLLEFGNPYGVNAFSGPLVVGGGFGGPYEARWLNAYQNVGATLTLYDNGVVNLNNHNEDFGAVTFNGGQVDTGTGQFAFYQSLTVNPSLVRAEINGYLGLPPGADRIFNVAQGGGGCDLLVNAVVFGNAPYLVKQGAGTMCLTAANTYAGVTLLEQGILEINNGSALGGSGCVISDGATLWLDGSAVLPNNFEMVGAGVGGFEGAVQVSGGGSWSLQGNILLDAATTLNVASSGFLYVNGWVSGNGPLTKAGPGTMWFGSGVNNTYSGDTIVSGGGLLLPRSSSILAVPGNLVIGPAPGGAAAFARLQASGNLGGSTVTVNGNGLFDLNGFNQSLVQLNLNDGGSVQTGAGTLSFFRAIGTGTRVAVNPGRTGASVISGHLFIYFGGSFDVGPPSSPGVLRKPALDVQATIADAFAANLVKNGLGEMRLSANNSFGATMLVNEGRLTLGNSLALGASAAGTVVNGNASLALEGGLLINNEALTLNSSNASALLSLSGSNTWNGPITLSRDAAIGVNEYLQVLGAVSGSGGLNKLSKGTLQFWGFVANTYGGLTTVSQGVLEGGRANLLSIPGNAIIGDDSTTSTTATLRSLLDHQFRPTADFTVNRSGRLELFPFPGVPAPRETLRTMPGGGQVNLGNTTSLTISNPVSFEFSGVLSGAGALNKRGLATLRLTGDSPGFTGAATLFGGDYRVDGSVPNSPVTVNASSRLRGDGVVGDVTVQPNGTLTVESKFPDHQGGDLEMASLALSIGAVVELYFFGPSATGGNDTVIVDGSVSLGLRFAELATGFLYPPREGDVVTLIKKTTAGPISGTFNGWPQGIVRKLGDVTVIASYTGGDGNDFTLTVTNLALGDSGYRLAEGNGNQTVEPDECNLLYLSLVNRRTNSLTITNAVLHATTPGTVVTIASANYPTIPGGAARENLTPFQFRTDPTLACGSPVAFELVVGVVGEGVFAIPFTLVSSTDCAHPSGGCESCLVVTGQFTTNTPTALRPLYFVGAPSICYPPKNCPGIDPSTNLLSVPYVTHSFTNSTTNEVCVTAQLQFDCPAAPTNALGAAACLDNFDPNQPCLGYLGDSGQGGPPYEPFSFQVPAGSNFTIVVSARTTNLVCSAYALELFGLPCPLPTLAISPDTAPNTVRVHWSTADPGWTAQQEGMLGSTFSNVIQQPVIVAGRYSLTNIATITNQFYRLKK